MCEETSRYVKIPYRYVSQVLLATVAAHLFSILILRHSASCESWRDSAMDVHSQHHQVLFAHATILEGWSIKRYQRYPCKICWHMSKTLRNSKDQNDVRCSPSTSYPFVFSISPVPCPCLHRHPQPTFAQEKHQTPANHQQAIKGDEANVATDKYCRALFPTWSSYTTSQDFRSESIHQSPQLGSEQIISWEISQAFHIPGPRARNRGPSFQHSHGRGWKGLLPYTENQKKTQGCPVNSKDTISASLEN